MTILAVLYSMGGLGDVGRHAVRAALDHPEVTHVRVLTQHPDRLRDKNWNSGGPVDHTFSKEDDQKMEVIAIGEWSDVGRHLDGVMAVVSCLGNRQPFFGDRVAQEGSEALAKAMASRKIERAVVISSIGIGNDWPPLEFHWAGGIMACLFRSAARREFRDLTGAEAAFRETPGIDYLFVRPVGLGEDVVPVGTWVIQQQKHKHIVGIALAKLDCARFMVQEALHPTRHRDALVLGSEAIN